MKLEDIKRLAHSSIERNAVESDTIEYKKSAAIKDRILKTACAYANNYMNREIGLILIGVQEVSDDETGKKAIPMRPITGIHESLIETTENDLKSLLAHVHPRINYHLLQDKIDDRFYIILAVEPGNDGPYETDKDAEKDKKIKLRPGRYIRIRRDTRLPNKREEFELLKKFADFHFTSELNETATLDDLNYEYMREYLVRTNASQDIRVLSKLDMARALHLISESEYGGYRAKNFAVLMFSDKPEDFIPYARVEIIREAVGTDKMESKSFTGPIWIQTQQAIHYFEDNIQASYTVRDPVTNAAHRVFNWPSVMFAELATNCILHKEYAKSQYVGIYVYKDHLVFVNHNRPVPPVTIEDLNTKTEFNDRNYLNIELKEMFFNLNLIQSYGSGIRRAKKAMADNGSPELIFEPMNDTDELTMVTAYINPEFACIRQEEETSDIAREIPQEIPQENSMTQEIPQEIPQENIWNISWEEKIENPLERKIIELILRTPEITRKELSQILAVPEEAVKYRLAKLRNSGLIEHQGATKAGKWVIIAKNLRD